MTDYIMVFVTVASSDEGERIAGVLVEERLAACVNQIKAVQSTYRWQGKIERGAEELLIIKSRRGLFGRVKKRVQQLHSYSVPEVVALPIVEGSDDYLRWLGEQLSEG